MQDISEIDWNEAWNHSDSLSGKKKNLSRVLIAGQTLHGAGSSTARQKRTTGMDHKHGSMQ
jgi:hypothetical protein